MSALRLATAICSGLLIAPAMHRPLGAQGTVATRVKPVVVDVGLAGVHFRDDSTSVFGPAVGASGGAQRGALFVNGALNGVATLGALTGSGALQAGIHGARVHGLSWELSGEGASVVGSSTTGVASSATGMGRLLWSRGSLGAWAGADAHAAQRPHSTPVGSAFNVGAWWHWATGQIVASLAQQRSAAELYIGRLRTAYVGTTPVKYLEGMLGMHWEADRATIDVSAGARRDEGAEHLYEPQLSAIAALWTRDRHAFVIGVSRQLPDFVRGADAADIVSVGMRFRQPAPDMERSSRIMPVMQVFDSAGTRMVRVRATGARTVEIMGDFSDWSAVALTAANGMFERAIPLGSGSHHLVVRIDGGAWRPAVNTPSIDDELGGRVGLLVIP